MLIVAMDIATNCGVAVGEAGGTPTAYSVDLGRGQSDDLRFSKLLSVTARLLSEHEPDLVAVEAPVGGPQTSHLLVGFVACVRGCVANRGVPLVSYHSGSVRKHFLGRVLTVRDFPTLTKGKAKQAIKGEVIKRCQLLGWDVPDHDAADAAALFDYAGAMAGVQTQPGGELFA